MGRINEICRVICLQKCVEDKVINLDKKIDYTKADSSMKKLFSRLSWDEGRKEIKAMLGDDPDGLKILTCMLHCSEKSYVMYKDKGISDKIFADTMKCFTRFIKEHNDGYGTLQFDRDWWTARHISLNLFRIGELEYEMYEKAGKRVISIHIPSDALLTEEKCSESYKMADEFFTKYYSQYSNVDFVCSSWLLSPELRKLLPETSHIRLFQDQFEIHDVNYGDMEFLQWVYKRSDIPYDLLPEDTTLQKNIKEHLLNGGRIGSAYGVLRK